MHVLNLRVLHSSAQTCAPKWCLLVVDHVLKALCSVNNQQMNTFFLTVFDDNLTLKQRSEENYARKLICLKPPQLEVNCYCRRHSDKGCHKKDRHPKYTEIVYQLLKTFTGQRTSSCKQHNKLLDSALLITLYLIIGKFFSFCMASFHAINTSDLEARLLYALILHRLVYMDRYSPSLLLLTLVIMCKENAKLCHAL